MNSRATEAALAAAVGAFGWITPCNSHFRDSDRFRGTVTGGCPKHPGSLKTVGEPGAPPVVAKLAVLDAFRNASLSKSEFARRLGKDEKEVRRILDPRHSTKLSTLTEALRVLGYRLVVAVEKAA